MAATHHNIGVIIPYISGVFVGEVLTEVLRQAPEFNCNILTIRTGDWRKQWNSLLSNKLCDGWILIMGEFGPQAIHGMTSNQRPVCSISKDFQIETFSIVKSDNEQGINSAMSSLFQAGHRNFGFIGCLESSDPRERYVAFQNFLSHNQLEFVASRVANAPDPNPSGGRAAAKELLSRSIDFSALIVTNDQNAAGAMQVFRENGIRIPEDIAIIAYDNSAYAHDPDYQISSLDQGFDQLAREALQETCRRIENPDLPAQTIRIAPQLVIRSSSSAGVPNTSTSLYTPEMMLQFAKSLNYGNEISRFLSNENNVTNIQTMLDRLSQMERFNIYAEIKNNRYFVGSDDIKGQSIEYFGSNFLDKIDTNSHYLFILPIFIHDNLDNALAITIPAHSMTGIAQLTLIAHELELAAIAIERSTSMKRLERLVDERTAELKTAQQKLIQTAKLQVMTPIVTGIAHHLNTPLSNCRMIASVLQNRLDSCSSDQVIMDSISMLNKNLERSLQLVEHFRRAAEIQIAESPQQFNVLQVIHESIFIFKVNHPTFTIGFDLPSGKHMIFGPPKALSETIIALLKNAVIHGQNVDLPTIINLTAHIDNKNLVFSVEDNGPGMSPELAERAFEPFFTTKLADSSGLGLTLVYNVISTLFHGTVAIRTSPGKGFRIECKIPLDHL